MTWVRPQWSRHGEGDGAEHGNEDEACLCGRGTLGEELLEQLSSGTQKLSRQRTKGSGLSPAENSTCKNSKVKEHGPFKRFHLAEVQRP